MAPAGAEVRSEGRDGISEATASPPDAGKCPAWQLGSTRPRVRLHRSSQPFRVCSSPGGPWETPEGASVRSHRLFLALFMTGFSWPGCNFCHLALCRALGVSTRERPWQNRDLRASHCFLECSLQV